MKNLLIISIVSMLSLSTFANQVCGSVYLGSSDDDVLFAIDSLADAEALEVGYIIPRCMGCSSQLHTLAKFEVLKVLAKSEKSDKESIKICVTSVNQDENRILIHSGTQIIIK